MTTKHEGEEMSRPVLVTTAHRGVFFGYLNGDEAKESLRLCKARCVLYWSQESRGFLGLAAEGPKKGSRVGPAADITLYDVTCVADVQPAAVERFEAAPWD